LLSVCKLVMSVFFISAMQFPWLLILVASKQAEALRFTSQSTVDGQLQQTKREASKIFAEIDVKSATDEYEKRRDLLASEERDVYMPFLRLGEADPVIQDAEQLQVDEALADEEVATLQTDAAATNGIHEATALDGNISVEESVGRNEVNRDLSEIELDVAIAQQHFDQVNQVFLRMLQDQEEAKARGEPLTDEDLSSIKTAHENARRAQETLAAKTTAFQESVLSVQMQERRNFEEGRDEAEAMMRDATVKFEALQVELDEATKMGKPQEELAVIKEQISQSLDQAKVGQRIFDTFVHELRRRESSQDQDGEPDMIRTPAVDDARRTAEALHVQAEEAALKWLEERRKTKMMEEAAAKLADKFHPHQDD